MSAIGVSANTRIKIHARVDLDSPVAVSKKRERLRFITAAWSSAEVTASTTDLDRQYIHTGVIGTYGKKDGTPGAQTAYIGSNELPDEIKAELRAGLDRALAQERAALLVALGGAA